MRSTSLALFGLALLAAPLGAQNLTYRGKECRVKTTLKSSIAKPIVKRIDRYCDHFEEFYDGLGMKPMNGNKAVVRVFATHDEFADFTSRTTNLSSPPAAYFSPSLNGVVSYYDPTDPYTRQVLFHEVSHQYMNRYTNAAPKWANEGLAEYFEGWQLAPDGALVKKRAAFFDLLVVQKALEEGKELPLQTLVEMEPKKFMDFREHYADRHWYLHYSTAWSLTYYFLEGPNEDDRAVYVDYMRDLNERGDRADPLGVEDWDALEKRWKEFVESLEIVAETADDHQILAKNYMQGKEFKKAVAEYEKVLELAPETPRMRYLLGFCNKRRGNYEDAEVHLKQAHEDDESDPQPAYMLARIVARLDRDEPEEQNLELALEYAAEASARTDDKSPFYLSFLARLQHMSGDSKAAGKTMKKVLKLVKKEEDDVVAYYEGLAETYGG